MVEDLLSPELRKDLAYEWPGPSHGDVECSKFVQKIKHTGRLERYMLCCIFANKHLNLNKA